MKAAITITTILAAVTSLSAATIDYSFEGLNYQGVVQDFTVTTSDWITGALYLTPQYSTGVDGQVLFATGTGTDDLIEVPGFDGTTYLYWFTEGAFGGLGAYQSQPPPGGWPSYNLATLTVSDPPGQQVPEPNMGAIYLGLVLGVIAEGWADCYRRRRPEDG